MHEKASRRGAIMTKMRQVIFGFTNAKTDKEVSMR